MFANLRQILPRRQYCLPEVVSAPGRRAHNTTEHPAGTLPLAFGQRILGEVLVKGKEDAPDPGVRFRLDKPFEGNEF
jgi:hypothetical protein